MKQVSQAFQVLVQGMVDKRSKMLSQLTPGKSKIVICIRAKGIRLPAIYEKHDVSSITVGTSQEALDYVFTDKPHVKPTKLTSVEATFQFLDVQIEIE